MGCTGSISEIHRLMPKSGHVHGVIRSTCSPRSGHAGSKIREWLCAARWCLASGTSAGRKDGGHNSCAPCHWSFQLRRCSTATQEQNLQSQVEKESSGSADGT